MIYNMRGYYNMRGTLHYEGVLYIMRGHYTYSGMIFLVIQIFISKALSKTRTLTWFNYIFMGS